VGFLFYASSMSFGLLKQLKDPNKNLHQGDVITFVANVVLGSDLGSILKIIELRKEHPHKSIRLVTPRLVDKQLLIQNYQYGVTQMRSPVAVGEIYKSNYDARITPQKLEPQFYKDGKFHDFGGRAKSMELQEGEHFFLTKGYRLEIESLFSKEDWDNLDSIISEHIDIRIVDSVEKSEVKDLVEKTEWLLTFKDFKKTSCENLYSDISPKRFLSYLRNKESMTSDIIDVCTSSNVQAGIALTWLMKKEMAQADRTFFIPQSMTHEWGHFIIEFEDLSPGHFCNGLFLIHEEEPQTEDLATKIKLMKRVLERVFPDFEENIVKEYIRFDEEMFISDIKDNLIEQIAFDYPTLKFLGQMSPMKPQFSEEKFLARVLLN